MPSTVRGLVAPLYLLACLLLGGSAQGVWQNALLQIGGVVIIAWAAAWPPSEGPSGSTKALLWLTLAAIVVVAVQTLPLPTSMWEHGPRARMTGDFQLLGLNMPGMPIALRPYAALGSLLGLLPPLAMFCAVARLRAYRPNWLAAALLGGTLAGIVLGALQVAGTGDSSRWYPYRQTNIGAAVGFFANANHMAILLVTGLPFIAAIGAAGRGRGIQRTSGLFVLLAGIAIVLLAGIALNGSIAGFVLVPPVIAASALVLFRPSPLVRRILVLSAGLALIGAAVLLSTSAIGPTKAAADLRGSVETRGEILRTTSRAIADYFPAGSGLGTFVQIYRTYESPVAVTNEYVIHAHNDYAELVLELGAAGIILIASFLAWWGAAVWAVWGRAEGGPFARAATIASAVLLTHSLVEFPLRTAALATCFAMCLGLMADRRTPLRRDAADLRPTRHLVIG